MNQPRKIDKNSYTPVYVQIIEDLKRLIPESTGKFYSDEELIQMYGVSRLTVRRAVEKLVDEGYLHRVRGVGTFVRSQKIGLPTTSAYLSTFEDQCAQAGKICVVKVIERSLVTTPSNIQESLCQEQVCYLERIRYVDGIPMVLDKFYLPEEVYYHTDDNFCSSAMIPDIIKNGTGNKPAYGTISAEAVLATHKDSEKLGITGGDPLLLRRMTIYYNGGTIAAVGKTLNRGDLFALNLKVNY